jgi:hypothetical protein
MKDREDNDVESSMVKLADNVERKLLKTGSCLTDFTIQTSQGESPLTSKDV